MSCYPAPPIPLGLEATVTPAHPCAYLPGRTSVSRGFRCGQVPDWAYQALMDAGFRRSGDVFYQMLCSHCRRCVPLRVPVEHFGRSRSQRRVWRRNQDLKISFGPPAATAEKHLLYRRYLLARHDGSMDGSWEEMEGFLFRSPTETLEVCYRDTDGELLGVGICDLTGTALSTVYFFFDPRAHRRSLGTFSSLTEIEMARKLGLAYYYLGYWVPGCGRMEYKSGFGPAEGLCTDGRWRPLVAAIPADEGD
jgi:arginine-tRNA-protein transferase